MGIEHPDITEIMRSGYLGRYYRDEYEDDGYYEEDDSWEEDW